MGLIKLPGEVIRERAHVRALSVIDQFREAIRPIYRPNRDLLTHVGTCTLIQIGRTKLLITAAHIMDQHMETYLWVGGENAPIPLTGEFRSSRAPSGDRSLDRYDFSVIALDDDLAERLGRVNFIDSQFISRAGGKIARMQCMFASDTQIPKIRKCTQQREKMKAALWMPFYSKTRIGKRQRYLVASMHVVEAANLSSAARSEYGLLARTAGGGADRISESRESAASHEAWQTATRVY